MAQYFNDFTGYEVDAPPDDFTARWVGSFIGTVRDDPRGSDSRVLELVNTSGSNNRGLFSWDAIDADLDRDDVEILIRFYVDPAEPDADNRIAVRASGGSGSETGYTIGHDRFTGELRHGRYVGGAFTDMGGVSKTYSNGIWYFQRVVAVGDSLMSRVWPDDDTLEPVAWDLVDTNTAITSAGWVGFFGFNANSWSLVDFIGVGTNGDAAPEEAPSGSTAVAVDLQLLFSVQNAVSRDAVVLFDVLNGVTGSAEFRWNVLNAVSRDVSLLHSVLNSVSLDVSVKWDVLNAISQDCSLLFNVLNSAEADASLKWSVLNAITADAELLWNVESALGTVARDLGLVWSVNNSVSGDVSLRWNVLNAVQRDSALLWNALNSIGADAALQWDVLNAVTSELELQWAVAGLAAVSRDLSIEWNVLNAVSDDMVLRWSVQGDELTPDLDGEIRINSLTKQFILTSVTKKFSIN